eukprot:2901065-Rhodomonas_salina.1
MGTNCTPTNWKYAKGSTVGPKDGEELPDFQELSEDAIWSAMEEWIEMEEDPEVVLFELENEAEAEDDGLEKTKEAYEVEDD